MRVLFQIGWLACVLGGNSLWLLLALAVLVIHLRWISSWAEEGRLILSVVIVGTAVDSVLRGLGVFEFQDLSPLIPLWLMLLWALLATTLRHCLAWSARPWWLASMLGAVGGALVVLRRRTAGRRAISLWRDTDADRHRPALGAAVSAAACDGPTA